MLAYVIDAARLAAAERILVVVGHGKEQVMAAFETDPDVHWVEQTEQLGTGHAVMCCRDALKGFHGTVVVIAGDMPLIQRDTIRELLGIREGRGDALTIATTRLDDPTGYGRIVRDGDGGLVAIVEHRDCTPDQLSIHEVNPSYYCFASERLFEALDQVKPSAGKGEYYITDTIDILRRAGHGVSALVAVPAEDAMGINSRIDLAAVNRAMQDRIQTGLMNSGVTIVDPDNTWIDAEVSIGHDTSIYPFTFIGTGAQIGERCRIGPFAFVRAGETVEDDAVVINTLGMEAEA
jgi:bifunctional UDP-N-acetylglucosamine pyrophosphorylase/glucosamine-1-phosphate N-acetyltransferase